MAKYKLPPYIAVLHRTFQVEAMNQELGDLCGDDGILDTQRDVIRVNLQLSDAQVIETLLHEIEHAINLVACVGDHTCEEDAVTRQVPVRMAVLRDNPKLLEIINQWCSGG